MHAIVVNVKVEPGRESEAAGYARDHVAAGVRNTPGVVRGYLLATPTRQFGITVFDGEDAARAAAEHVRAEGSDVDYVEIESVELADVIAEF
ncbi:MAG: hypothetical protein ACXVP7_00290 [Actinomycetota bacterium]